MPRRTLASQAGAVQTDSHPHPTPSRGAGTKSPQRILQERLTLGQYKPRAWMVALFLDAYSRQDVDGRRFATVYHALVAAETGLSLASVRRALRELTSGAFPLFEKRGASGQPRTVRARTWQRENWRAVAYYWIENLDAYLAARDTARAGNLLAYEERKQALHADRVRLQTEMLTGKVDASTYETAILQLDAQARGRLPKEAAARKPTVRCLTAKQL